MSPDEFRLFRLSIRMSQAKAAKNLGVSRQTVNAWETRRNAKGIPSWQCEAFRRLVHWSRITIESHPHLYTRNAGSPAYRPSHPGHAQWRPAWIWELTMSSPPPGGTIEQMDEWAQIVQKRLTATAPEGATAI